MKKRHIFRWALLALFIVAIAWIAAGEGSCAQGIRALMGRKPDQPVLNSSFQIYPRGFRYYKFSLPAGSKNIALVGHFTASASASGLPGGTSQQSNPAIEVLVLTQSAFDLWRTGSSAPAVYDSGTVSQQNLTQPLPAGGGDYYLVFSNRFDSGSAKKVSAELVLHSTSWFAY